MIRCGPLPLALCLGAREIFGVPFDLCVLRCFWPQLLMTWSRVQGLTGGWEALICLALSTAPSEPG